MEKKLKITLIKSKSGRIPNHCKTISALGLGKINQSVIKPDNPQIRGMIKQINYLVKVEGI